MLEGIALIVTFAVLLALIPAVIAQRKGRRFMLWFVFGLVLWLVALVASLAVSDKRATSGSPTASSA